MDVTIFGAGVAGWSTALALAGKANVTVVDARTRRPALPIAETLPGAASRMLEALGVCTEAVMSHAAPRHVSRSLWSGPTVLEQDGLADPDGPGWIVDRTWLADELRRIALQRNVSHHILDELPSLADAQRSKANFLVDATGRRRFYVGQLVPRACRDTLVAYRLLGTQREGHDAHATLIEADPEGWWYSSVLPDRTRMVAFHTDAVEARARGMTLEGFMSKARGTRLISPALEACGFAPSTPLACASAGAGIGVRANAGKWLAVGDAALECDPIASQGLMNAIFTGIECSAMIDGWPSSPAQAASAYETSVRRVWQAYAHNVRSVYAAQAVHDGGFWRRRRAALATYP